MRSRVIFCFAMLNALALTAGFYFLKQTMEVRQTKLAAAQLKKTPPAPAVRLTQQPKSPPPLIVYKTNHFNWAQVESSDYREYIANLRSIGCPEATIKDLIMTDVLRLYASRRGQFFNNGREFKYWETDEKRKLKPSQLEERERQLAQIDKELPAVLRELLGINYEREINKYFVDTNEDDRRLAFLSEDKRAQLLVLRDQFEGKRERLLDSVQNGRLSVSQLDQLRNLEDERSAAMRNILTAEEYEQYQLCSSPTADRLRKELVGFNPTEQEFRAIFLRQQALDSKYADQDMSDETVLAAKLADQTALEKELRPLLGESRTVELERSRDEDYRNLCTFVEQYDLPPSTSQSLLEMRQIVESERQKLIANKSLPLDRRLKALEAIRIETEQTIRQTMGDKAFSAYSQGVGRWIQGAGVQQND